MRASAMVGCSASAVGGFSGAPQTVALAATVHASSARASIELGLMVFLPMGWRAR
jgi:hypothetical protein